MKSEDKWLNEQKEIAMNVIRGESHREPIEMDMDTSIAALILSTISNPNLTMEW